MPTSPPLQLSLSAHPPNPIAPSALADFRLEFTVVNSGAGTLDPQLERSSRLLVDGKPAADWDVAIASGPRDDRWHALPPGDRLQFAYRFGASLFRGPGRYSIVLEVGHAESPPVTVVILP